MALDPTVQAAVNSCALTMQQKMHDTANATAWNRTLTGHCNAVPFAPVICYYKDKLSQLVTLMTTNGCVAADVATLKTTWGV